MKVNFWDGPLTDVIEPVEINSPETYKDVSGITHIYVLDTGQAYELINGQWVEKLPF